MSRINSIPTTRVGDYFIRQRLTAQVQSDQSALFALQNQISTGRRLQLPSDDAPAALRAINLQRLLDRKAQIRTNVQASNLYLGAAEQNLSTVSGLISGIRAEAVGVAGTLATDSERQAVIKLIDGALQTLVATGDAKLQGRYLFAGSQSQTQPYSFNGEFVEYRGNEGVLRSYVDLERLFETNVSGTAVFGGISSPVEGSVDLNPHLTSDTLLSAINAGSGISRNGTISVSVTDAGFTETSLVNLSSAVTIGDVARLIEDGAPAGSDVTVEVTGTGITLRTASGTVTVGEVSNGKSAKELGILPSAGTTPTATLVGNDLNPAVLKTTKLDNLLGTKAQGRVVSSGANNDLLLTASQNGTSLNGVTVEFVGGGVAGSEVASYNAGTTTLTVQIQDGFSTASQVAAAINAEGTFSAAIDYHDATTLSQAGLNVVTIANFGAITSGGSGTVLDTSSGLNLTNGGTSVALDISAAETVEDLLNLIQGADLGFVAQINATANGINVRSQLSGADFTIGENGGTTATQLGIRTYTGSTELANFNRGIGVVTNDLQDDTLAPITADLLITARDGTALTVDLDAATTLSEAVTLVNNAPGNHVGTTSVTASLTPDGRGIQLADSSTPITGSLVVQGNAASETLGFLSAGAASIADNTANGLGDYSLNSYRHSREDDLVVVARDGTELWVDLTGVETVQDVIDRINTHSRNNAGTTLVTARLAATGNGIELVDSSTGAGTLSVAAAEGSQAADLLGFLPNGTITTNGSGASVLQSEDRHTLETDSIFNSLIRLRTALQEGDSIEIGRSIERLDIDHDRVNLAAAEIGIRLQSLEVIDFKLEDEDVLLRGALSNDLDVDLVEAISNLTARQFAFEASLRSSASILQMSLLNYI